MNKVTPFLMFNDQLEAAIELYTSTFPRHRVVAEDQRRAARLFSGSRNRASGTSGNSFWSSE